MATRTPPAAADHGSLSSLRENNRVRVLEALRRSGTASRADLARATGLSRSTVSSLVAGLQRDGLVVDEEDAGAPGERGGRPPVLLRLDPTAGTVLAVDVGHRHVRVAIADLSSRVLAERRTDADVDRSASDTLDAIAALVDDALAEAGTARDRIVACGMGMPGPIDLGSGVVGSTSILPGWAGLRPGDELGRRLGVHVEVDNDANLGALGEATFGAGRGVADVIYVKVASGVGAGLLLGGRLHRGASGIAGELGHVIVDPAGPICRCGNRGCLETVVAAPALLELLRGTHGDGLTRGRLLKLAEAGDVAVRRLLLDAGRAVGRALADLCNCLNPGLVIAGGDLAQAGHALIDGIRESIDRFALPAAASAVRVTAGVLGERAELLGALAAVQPGFRIHRTITGGSAR